MSLELLKQEAAALDDTSRKELFSFLISLREQQWAGQARKLASALDDPNPNRWLTLDELQSQLAQIPEPPEN